MMHWKININNDVYVVVNVKMVKVTNANMSHEPFEEHFIFVLI